MTALFSDPALAQALGWTLVHFLWQGAALAAVLYAALSFMRSPETRYAAGVATLTGMSVAPLVTFFAALSKHQEALAPSKLQVMLSSLSTVAHAQGGIPVTRATQSLLALDWTDYLVCAWLAGVVIFALRALGGYVVLRRIMRDKCEPLTGAVLARCNQLQARLGLGRGVRYLRSELAQAPSVVGWFRPAVLVPISALAGLSPQQLEAVIVHELAHIKRWDCFVNLFQIAIETLLFYHPAVWWVSRTIRTERENCCDDVAVEVCGDPGDYARALALMEGWRTPPALVLAASHGSLRNRVARVLGVSAMNAVPQGGVAILACLCIAGVVLGASTLGKALDETAGGQSQVTQTQVTQSETIPPVPPTANLSVGPTVEPVPAVPAVRSIAPPSASPRVRTGVVRVARPEVVAEPFAAQEPTYVYQTAPASPAASAAPAAAAAPESPSSSSDNEKGSYIEAMRALGLKDLTVDHLIALKTQGVTPAYIREMRAAGLDGSVGELIAMRVQGVTPDYVRRVRAAGWPDPSLGQIIAMKVQGVDPAEASQFEHELGLQDMSLGQLIAFKVQGVTPEYVRALKSAGFKDVTTGRVIAAKVQGITPEFVKKVREHGFTDLTLHQLIGLKTAGIF